ncbi:MAG: iron-containing alcohol dehydrogenase [Rhizobiales bacterium]|nr:iron-containing alcohol dehydrogenase [Hyphomicrobiales bacterium]NRB15383.1 iron-containing alcohol dehydrogenase [Hyphomicrobiales bacterium]
MDYFGNWSYPTQIKFGNGRINELAKTCLENGIKRPLLVTDKGLASLPITQNALDTLAAGGVKAALFSDVDPNPNEKNLNDGVAAFKAGDHDGVIAFGGGSGLDLGKLVALMAGQTLKAPLNSVWDLEDVGDWYTRANADAIYPVIAVPTTAGTGSEVGRAGVLTDSKTETKKIIFHPKLMPVTVICDPELTVGMPPMITAGTGMDAFAHCLEAFCSPHYHPMSQGIALEGMRLVKDNLLNVYTNSTDLVGRAEMMSAAAMGATAFQKGLGAIHALSHPIGAVYHTHHGTTNAVVMQPVLNYNRPKIETRIEQAAAYLGISGGFDGFYNFVGALNDALKIPKNLAELGVDINDIDRLAAMALLDPSTGGNPVEMTLENTKQLLKSCFN